MPRSRAAMCLPLIGFYLCEIAWGSTLPVLTPQQYWLSDLFNFVALPVAVLLFYTRRLGLPLSQFYRYSTAPDAATYTKRELILLGLIYTVPVCIVIVLSLHIGHIVASFFPHVLAGDTYNSVELSKGHFLRKVYLAATAGLMEELMYRGGGKIVWRYAFPSGGNTGYVLFTTLIFASLHWPHGLFNIIQAALTGLVLGVFYIRLNDLRPLIIAHALSDFIMYL